MKLKSLLMFAVAAFAMFDKVYATPEEEENKILKAKAMLEPPFAVSAGISVQDKYIGFSNGAVFYPKAITYGWVNVIHKKSGVYLGVWASTGFNGEYSNNWDDEVDLTLGWSKDLGFATFDISQAYFDCFGVGEVNANDVWKTQVTLTGKPWTSQFLSIAPYAQYELYITDSHSTLEGGSLYTIGFINQVPITPFLTFTNNSNIKYDDGGFGLEHGFLWKQQNTLEWRVNDHVTISAPEITIWSPMMSDSRNVEHVLSATVRFSF